VDGEFEKLKNLMNSIKLDSTQNREHARRELVDLLKLALTEITGQPFLSKYEDMKIDEFLQNNGIPTRENSPLFSNKISDLLDMSSNSPIQDCKIRQLINWIFASKEMLRLVGRNRIPHLNPVEINGCDKSIPKYEDPIESKHFKNDVNGYEYQDKLQGLNYLWVPKEFLP
jgi:hypothetical protein